MPSSLSLHTCNWQHVTGSGEPFHRSASEPASQLIRPGEEPLDLGDQRRGFARLDHDRIEPAVARLIELLDVRVTGRGDERDMRGCRRSARSRTAASKPVMPGNSRSRMMMSGRVAVRLLDRRQAVLGCHRRRSPASADRAPRFRGHRGNRRRAEFVSAAQSVSSLQRLRHFHGVTSPVPRSRARFSPMLG